MKLQPDGDGYMLSLGYTERIELAAACREAIELGLDPGHAEILAALHEAICVHLRSSAVPPPGLNPPPVAIGPGGDFVYTWPVTPPELMHELIGGDPIAAMAEADLTGPAGPERSVPPGE